MNFGYWIVDKTTNAVAKQCVGWGGALSMKTKNIIDSETDKLVMRVFH